MDTPIHASTACSACGLPESGRKERPILFSGAMVRAILAGRKTQTRRLVKPRHFAGHLVGDLNSSIEKAPGLAAAFCPYGQPFDLLWVRETWQAATGSRRDARILTCPRPDTGWVEYAATCDDPPPRWRPSIHMPRWASRILLEITAVRVERLQDISETDACAEGIYRESEDEIPFNGPWYISAGDTQGYAQAKEAFHDLWESINGAGSWALNPWVWVVEFKDVSRG